MFMIPIIRKLLLEKEELKIIDAIKSDKEGGCQTYTQALLELTNKGYVTKDTALRAAPNAEELRMLMSGITISEAGGGIV
jgi:Tfp pilus assembly ATPase PilU